jgi:xanthine dehydrogenase accessory factor
MGVPTEALARLKAPAGLDIGARAQEEIALSIMAEIAQVHAAMSPGIALDTANTDEPAEAIDPVCGMTVVIASARHTSDYDGQTWYFCCGGCKAAFDVDPRQYAPN